MLCVSVTPEQTTRSLLGGTTRGGDGSLIAIPATVAWASIVIVIEAVLNVVRGLVFGGNTAALTATMIKNNAKAKKPKSPYGVEQALHDLDRYKHTSIVQALIMGGALVVLAILLRGGRMAHNARWLVILILIFTGGPMAFTTLSSDLRPVYNVLSALVAVTSIAAIALIVVAPSRAFFRATRAATGKPSLFGPKPGATAGGQTPRPGGLFGGLFGPPRTSTPPSSSAPKSDDNPSAGRSTAKVRAANNDAAVAKGADLARERAKASKAKSRRSS
jgi:hypothetical protein